MTKKETKTFERYSEIVNQIKILEEEKDKLGETIFSEIEKLGVDQVKSDYGTFYFTTRKSWVYPDYVKEAEVVFKTKKKESEEKGEATFEEKKSLAYKSK